MKGEIARGEFGEFVGVTPSSTRVRGESIGGMDFSGFFSAYFSNWVGYMSGPGSVALTIIVLYRPNSNHKRFFLCLAALVFLVAPIRIWTIEHRARQVAENNNLPRLSASIGMVVWGKNTMGVTTITLDVEVMNSGAPSIARTAGLFVIVGSEKFVGKIYPAPFKDQTFTGADGKPSITLERDEYLGRRAVNNPIERGGGITGWLLYAVPGLSIDDMESGKAKLFLQFLDVDGNSMTTSVDVKASGSTGGVYLPQGSKPMP